MFANFCRVGKHFECEDSVAGFLDFVSAKVLLINMPRGIFLRECVVSFQTLILVPSFHNSRQKCLLLLGFWRQYVKYQFLITVMMI